MEWLFTGSVCRLQSRKVSKRLAFLCNLDLFFRLTSSLTLPIRAQSGWFSPRVLLWFSLPNQLNECPFFLLSWTFQEGCLPELQAAVRAALTSAGSWLIHVCYTIWFLITMTMIVMTITTLILWKFNTCMYLYEPENQDDWTC